MPLPPAHKRVQVQGVLLQASGGGSEIFEFGWADDSALSLSALSALVGTHLAAHIDTDAMGWSQFANLVGVRAEDVNGSGIVTDSFYTAVSGGPVHGNDNLNDRTVLSACLTLETNTDTGTGRKVRGRFYPPAICPGGYTGSTTDLSSMEAYVSTWATVLGGMVTDGASPAVASSTGGGQIAQVTALSGATVIDTIRRRRNHVTVQRTPHSIIR